MGKLSPPTIPDKPITSAQQAAEREAELAVLGRILHKPDCIKEAADLLQPNDFGGNDSRTVFEGMLDLWRRGEAVEIVALKNSIGGGLHSIGGPKFLAVLPEKAVITGNITYYAELIKKGTARRRLARIADQIKSSLAFDEDPADISAAVLQDLKEAEAQSGNLNDLLASCYTIQDEQGLEFAELVPILDPVIYSESVNMIHGAPGSTKTWLSMAIALSMATGESLIPGWTMAADPMNVLMVDGEMNQSSLRTRKNQLLKGAGLSLDSLHGEFVTLSGREYAKLNGRTLDLSRQQARDKITALVERLQTKFLVLDNLYSLLPGINLKASEEYAPFNSWLIGLQSAGVIILFAHHDNKAEDFTGANEISFNISTRLHVKINGLAITISSPKLRDGNTFGHLTVKLSSNDSEDAISIVPTAGPIKGASPRENMLAYIRERRGTAIQREELPKLWRQFGYGSLKSCQSNFDKLKGAVGFLSADGSLTFVGEKNDE